MGVILHGQAEVAGRDFVGLDQHVLAGPHQLDHGQREVWEVVGVLLFLRQQEVVESLGIGLDRQLCSQPRGHFDDAIPTLGSAHDAADGGHAGVFKGAGDDAVGRHHELLNQRRGAILFQLLNLHRLPGHHHRARFYRLQVQRSVLEAPANHALRSSVLQLELCSQIGAGCNLGWSRTTSLKPRAHAVVCQLRAVVHQCPISLPVRDCARRVYGELDHQRDAVFVLIQRSNAL